MNSYQVQAGDTMSSIAASNGIPIETLISYNPQISDPNFIYPGEAVNLSPSDSSVTVAAASTAPASSSSIPSWVWIASGIVALAAAGFILYSRFKKG